MQYTHTKKYSLRNNHRSIKRCVSTKCVVETACCFFYSSSVSRGVLFLASKVKSSAKKGPYQRKKSKHVYTAQSRQSAKLFSCRRNWDSPSPSPARECAPFPPLWYWGGGGTLAGEKGSGRVQIPTRGHTLWYSLCMYFVVYSVGSVLYTRARTQCIPRLLASFISDV
jgi:hypothetical protein